jgi:hypothetical protein
MRIDKLVNDHRSQRNKKITGIEFIIPGEPVQQFGKTFEDMDACLAYCDKNDIPYKVENAAYPNGAHSYIFPTAENADKANPLHFEITP